jgi:dUTP pyrophosphatase
MEHEKHEIKTLGKVVESNKIAIFPEYKDAMDGLKEDMLIWILYIFHLSGEKLKVHPKGDMSKPLQGVFSTRSPYRLNRIGMSATRIKKIEENQIVVEELDALPGSPVIDIKPYSEVYDLPGGSVLSRESILKRIRNENLISDYIDLEKQLQPNGFDCTLKAVGRLKGEGKLDFDNSERKLPEVEIIDFGEQGWVFLEKGVYRAYINEVVRLGNDLMAFGRPRSSLVRAGANLLTAVWDAGYTGRSEVGLVVYNPDGIYLKKNARILQLVFIKLTEKTKPYSGAYSGENI